MSDCRGTSAHAFSLRMRAKPLTMGAMPNAHPNFLSLRIFLALSVVFAHFAAISGDERSGYHLISSTIAVQAFFVISGWIVAQSFERSATLGGFWLRRFARLYPLYAAVIGVQALLGYAFGSPGPSPLAELGRYLGVNLVFANFLQPSLFGLFADAPVQAINPSLWTLKIEVLFYLTVPVLVLAVRGRGPRALAALYVVSALAFYLSALRSEQFGRQFPGQLRYFVAGMACWQLAAASRPMRRRVLAPVALASLWLSLRLEHSYLWSGLHPLLVAAFVFGTAYCVRESRRMPDISYGLYILHAPLIQLGFLFGWLAADGVSLALAILTTAVLSAATWYGLEKPAIQLAKRVSEVLDRRATHASCTEAGQPPSAAQPGT